jgi:hypothetical protein
MLKSMHLGSQSSLVRLTIPLNVVKMLTPGAMKLCFNVCEVIELGPRELNIATIRVDSISVLSNTSATINLFAFWGNKYFLMALPS